MNKKTFTVKNEDGVELELAIRKPTAEIRIKSQLVYNKAFKEAIDHGSILQRQLEDYATKLDLWSDEKKAQVEDLQNQLRSLELKLRGEANNFGSKDEAKACAMEMKKLRWKLIRVQQSKNDLYPITSESFADEARTKYFVSACTVDNTTGKPFFKSYEDYLSQSDTDVATAAMNAYWELTYGDITSVEAEFPENVFLRKYHFVDEKFRPVNASGQLVDIETGKLIDEDGYYLDDQGRRTDRDGNPLDKDGQYLVATKEFYD